MLICSANESRSPLEFEEEVEVRFKEMNNAESGEFGLSWIVFYHDVDGVTPSAEDEAFFENRLHKSWQEG